MTSYDEADGDLAAAWYSRMRWNTPLSEEHAALLIERLDVRPGAKVLDLGCGWGELLMRAVGSEASGTAAGVGIDTDVRVLGRGRQRAEAMGLVGRTRLIEAPAATWREPADRVLCVGSAHALGDDEPLRALASLVRPGGRLLLGDAVWDRPPTPEAEAIFGQEVPTTASLVRQAVEDGWRVLHVSTADQREWDDFESTWRLGRQEWLLEHLNDGRASAVKAVVDRQLEEYVSGYRGLLGFCYLVLAR